MNETECKDPLRATVRLDHELWHRNTSSYVQPASQAGCSRVTLWLEMRRGNYVVSSPHSYTAREGWELLGAIQDAMDALIIRIYKHSQSHELRPSIRATRTMTVQTRTYRE